MPRSASSAARRSPTATAYGEAFLEPMTATAGRSRQLGSPRIHKTGGGSGIHASSGGYAESPAMSAANPEVASALQRSLRLFQRQITDFIVDLARKTEQAQNG